VLLIGLNVNTPSHHAHVNQVSLQSKHWWKQLIMWDLLHLDL